MNKKIFTLLAGACLLLATVFSVTAQTTRSYIDDQNLRLAGPVSKLEKGPNKGYYHLKVDSIITSVSGGTSGSLGINTGLSQDLVLFMGIPNAAGEYPLFIDEINPCQTLNFSYFKSGRTSASVAPLNSDASASSLWCTIVNDFEQGNYITFDFINKQQKEVPLEVDIYGYNTLTNGWQNVHSSQGYNIRQSKDTYLVPGTISGWQFSGGYKTSLDARKPLFSWIGTGDSVAVLCMASWGVNANVVVKIASILDVNAGRVPGMLYFTLVEAEPFTLSAADFNTMLGSADDVFGKLKFDPDVTGTGITNPFTQELIALDIAADRLAILNVQDVGANGQMYFYDEDIVAGGGASWANGPMTSTVFSDPSADKYQFIGGLGSNLTSFGYIHLKANTGRSDDYLYVQHDYYIDRPSGTRFLNFGGRSLGSGVFAVRTSGGALDWGGTLGNFDNADEDDWEDAYLFGQSIWRLVYYPSGDSIYINPYQATYLPYEYADIYTAGKSEMYNPDTDEELDWFDWRAQASNRYTYRAYPYFEGASPGNDHPYLALDPASVGLPIFEGVDEDTDPFMRMVARLKYGANNYRVANTKDQYEYTFYHKLYVTRQALTTGATVITLRNGNMNNHGINTHINFGIYVPCNYAGTNRATLDPDLYLIRNERGEYLHVPLYSATDSAIWVSLAKDVHPEFLPSFQWVVQKRYPNSDASPIILINREFNELIYEDIILEVGQHGPFVFRVPNDFKWNRPELSGMPAYKVNEQWVAFGSHNTTANQLKTFIKLGKDYKNDEQMGYTYIDPNVSIVNRYAFKYLSGIDYGYITTTKHDWFWTYPAADTTVYVKQANSQKLYFNVDTVDAPIGAYKAYGYKPLASGNPNYIADLVQLKRQAYQLWVEDPYLLICDKTWGIMNGGVDDKGVGSYYTISPKGDYKEFLGRPVFYLRHYYHLNNDYAQPGFALVQKIDALSYSMNPGTTQRAAFIAYLEDVYGPYFANIVDGQIKKQQESSLDLGFFVAAFDDQTDKLKAALRADASRRVSTFQLERDDDPIYRRFNKAYDHPDGLINDDPKTLKFFEMNQPSYELFENTGFFPNQANYWKNYGVGVWNTPGMKNYLGSINIDQHPTAQTAIYVDTAYVNRGTGYIKPQYMLVVDTSRFEGGMACDDYGVPNIPIEPYLRGRYLVNATDSAKNSLGELVNKDYIWDTKWERFVFTDAIHARDHLYILSGVDITSSAYTRKLADGTYVLDLDKLDVEAAKANTRIRKVYLGDNYHKDVVFSMRLIERGATDFLIESETGEKNRSVMDNRIFHYTPSATDALQPNRYAYRNSNGPIIAPCVGGWVKRQGFVPVISRSDVVESIFDGDKFNVRLPENAKPVANEEVAAGTAVIGNDGSVTILGAAGKKVVISNILGQTVASAVLSSDNAVIAAPKGVVIVSIEGEAAVKALVK